MGVIFSHITALEIMRRLPRQPQPVRLSSSAANASFATTDAHSGQAAVDRLIAFDISVNPIEVLVPRRAMCYQSSSIVRHLHSAPLPNEAVLSYSPSIACCGPELVALQLATHVSYEQLLLLLYELCGIYSVRHDLEKHMCQQREPLTSRARLEALLREMPPGTRGVATVRNALRFVNEMSASPRESKLCMLLCLPTSRGGYGLPMPVMNSSLMLQTHNGSERRSPDLLWPQARLCVEYDSDEEHAGSQQIADDARRRNEFVANGYTVLTVTRAQLNNARMFDDLAQTIAERIGHRMRIARSCFSERAARLRHELHVANL